MLRSVSGPLSAGPAAFPVPAPRRGQADELVWEGLCHATPAGTRPLFLDLHVPRPAAPAQDPPVIAWVHGGGWEAGSRRRLGENLERGWLVERMVLAGFAVALVDYRLAAEAAFPAQVDDLAAALAWLADHRGALGIDTSRLALWGESAGGHLALLVAATRAGAVGAATVRAVVDWYAPTDLPALGSAHWEEAAWSEPASSPLHAVTAAMPPTVIVHGREDPLVPLDQSTRLAARLADLGVAHRLLETDGGHVFDGPRSDEVVAEATSASLDFLCEHLGHVRGPVLDAELAAWHERMAEAGVRPWPTAADPEEARQRAFEFRRELNAVDYGVASVEDAEIHSGGLDLPVRIQEPVAPSSTVLLYFHGGGWVTGDLDSHEKQAARLAQATPASVIQVDYRRAPEHPFPAAYDDAVAATAWVAAHLAEFGSDTLVLAGESAGGNLALSAALWARDHGVPVDALLLNYPTVLWETTARTAGLQASYLGGDLSLATDPRVSPGLADLRGLPPVVLGAGGLDPDTEDLFTLANRLRAADVPLRFRVFPSLAHGFFSLAAASRAADRAAEQMCRDLNELVWDLTR